MNTIIKYLLFLLLILSPIGNAISEEIAVIVNPAFDASTIDKNQIEQIYMGKSTTLRPYDQRKSSPIRQAFYKLTTGRSARQMKALWAKLLFSGRARPPEELVNSKAVKRTIATDPKGIGYIDQSEVDNTVKVVMTLQTEE